MNILRLDVSNKHSTDGPIANSKLLSMRVSTRLVQTTSPDTLRARESLKRGRPGSSPHKGCGHWIDNDT